jgi:hypothetical protein
MPFINRCGATIGETSNNNIYSGIIINPNLDQYTGGIDVGVTIGDKDEFSLLGIHSNTCKFHSYTNFNDYDQCYTVDNSGYLYEYNMISKEGSIISTPETWFGSTLASGTYRWVLIHNE